jgi:hypothetical protein
MRSEANVPTYGAHGKGPLRRALLDFLRVNEGKDKDDNEGAEFNAKWAIRLFLAAALLATLGGCDWAIRGDDSIPSRLMRGSGW